MSKILKINALFRWIVSLCFILFLLTACNKKLDEYYEIPDNLKGTVWTALENKGNYTLFLKGIELAGYKDFVDGKGLVTVIAPNDSAMQVYLNAKGFGSIESVPVKELTKLITYHLVYNLFGKEKFFNYQPYPAGFETNPNEYGLFYKHRTKSRDGIDSIIDPTEIAVVKHKIFHKERFLPVFSAEIFNTKKIDAKANYEFFYPGSTWTGGTDGFNISNASVKNYAVVTDNGFIYEVNKVLEPLETVYTELKNDNNYTEFFTEYNRFANIIYDQTLSTNYGNGDSLYLFYHSELPKIASEWTYNGENSSIPDYANTPILSGIAYNVFSPDNTALNTFFNSFWAGYYPTLNDVGFLPIKYLLKNHVFEGNVIFPQEIETGIVKSVYGNSITFNRNDALKKQMCVNGTLYGINKVLVPPMFYSVTGPALQDPKFKMFMNLLDKTNLIVPLMSDQVSFKLYLPSDSTLLNENTLVRGMPLNYVDYYPKKYGQQFVQIMDAVSGLFVNMNTFISNEVVQYHVAVGNAFAKQGNQEVYKTMSNYRYLLIRNDSLFSSGIYNRNLPGTTYSLIPGTRSNGTTYELTGNGSALTADNTTFTSLMPLSSINHPAEFDGFKKKVLANTNFVSTNFNFTLGERFIVFIPSNDNSASFDTITTSNANDFAKYHFVNVSASNLGDYPFPGAGVQGQLTTFLPDGNGGFEKLTLVDTGTELKLVDKKGREAKIIGFYPHMYSDGAAYLIDNVLLSK